MKMLTTEMIPVNFSYINDEDDEDDSVFGGQRHLNYIMGFELMIDSEERNNDIEPIVKSLRLWIEDNWNNHLLINTSKLTYRIKLIDIIKLKIHSCDFDPNLKNMVQRLMYDIVPDLIKNSNVKLISVDVIGNSSIVKYLC